MKRVFFFIFGLAIGVGGALLLTRMKPAPGPVGGQTPRAGSGLTVFLPVEHDGKAELKPETVPTAPGSPEKLVAATVEALLHPAGGKKSPLPEGTRLRSVRIAKEVAVIDFSQEMVRNFPGGSQWELLVLGSIVRSLTHIEGIRKVQILVEGEKLESLGGHIEITEPLTPEMVAPPHS